MNKEGKLARSKRNEVNRRTFLKVTASSVALLMVSRSFAYNPAVLNGLQFLNAYEAQLVEAVAARIWPGDANDPGAKEAAALIYIDRALSGAYSGSRNLYRRGLRALDAFAQSRLNKPFTELAEAQQDEVLREVEANRAPGFSRPTAAEFFGTIRRHTMEGVFADPIYGGNRDFAGWKVVNYPGAYYFFTEAEQQSFEPLNKPFQSVADL
jgi:gluconate 2-dehydrogenase gamma chain